MKKSSTVTVRHAPVGGGATAGNLLVEAHTLEVQTRDRVELVDLTERVRDLLRRSSVREGTASLFSLHTTCAIFINEVQAALHSDIRRFLEQVIAQDATWMHNDPAHSDCDRMNADSHLRAMLLGHSMTLQVTGGDIVLGTWQRILAAEMDGPRTRTIRVQFMGSACGPSEATE
jgi:secondary thiamine-phosphate synthase enzyme